MTRVWWVRHGPTRSQVITPRDAPADLSDTAALARLRAALPLAPMVASPLLRAQMTARALAPDGMVPRTEPGFAEIDHGAWEGLHWSEIATRWPDLSRRIWTDPGTDAPPGGESWAMVAARADAAADRLLGPAEVIVVAHHGVILTQLARARPASPAQILAQPIAPLSITRLVHDGIGWREDLVNHIP